MEEVRLNELTKDEFWDVARRLRPDLTREQFDADWEEFQAAKAKRSLQ